MANQVYGLRAPQLAAQNMHASVHGLGMEGRSMTKDEALRFALEALEYLATQIKPDYEHNKAITAIKAALEAKDEPVAYIRVSKTGHVMACAKSGDFYALPDKTLLYTTPPQRKPLTDEELTEIFSTTKGFDFYLNFARAIEAAHGIKGEA
jgi:hypothetical protein